MPEVNKDKERKLNFYRAAELFKYDPETGIITNRVTRGSRAKAGAVAGSAHGKGYWSIGVNCEQYQAHRLAWLLAYGKWPDDQIDHIDGNRRNNRIDNLRVATQPENLRNQKIYKNNTSGVMGVYWLKEARKWRAYIRVSGIFKNIGTYANKADAIQARKAAEIQYGFHANHGRPA